MLGSDISMLEVNGGSEVFSMKAGFVCTEMCGTDVMVGICAAQ